MSNRKLHAGIIKDLIDDHRSLVDDMRKLRNASSVELTINKYNGIFKFLFKRKPNKYSSNTRDIILQDLEAILQDRADAIRTQLESYNIYHL